MKTPASTWEADYRHDRRSHRHRCRCCNRILNEGDRVLMARVSGRDTWAIHIVCASRPHIAPWTWRDAMTAWGTVYLRQAGYRLPLHPMELAA